MATRFKLPASGSAAVSPAFQSYTHSTVTTRRPLPTTDSSSLATTSIAPDVADHLIAGDTFFAQFVSAPLGVNVFTAADAFDMAIQCFEDDPDNNLFLQVFIGIVSNDGATLLATLRSKVADDVEVSNSLQNRYLSSTLSGSYTTVGNERLVIEFSVTGTPTAQFGTQGHNASMRFGSSGAGGDLPENNTETGSTFNPWLEFANTISFIVPHAATGTVNGPGAVISGAGKIGSEQGGVPVIRYLLANNGYITAMIPASRIMAGDLPINTELPAIAITQISGVPRLTMAMTEPYRLHTDRVQVSAIFKGPAGEPGGGGYPAVKAMIPLILAACPNQHGKVAGVFVDSILPDLIGPDLQDDATSLFSQSVDFIVKWHSP